MNGKEARMAGSAFCTIEKSQFLVQFILSFSYLLELQHVERSKGWSKLEMRTLPPWEERSDNSVMRLKRHHVPPCHFRYRVRRLVRFSFHYVINLHNRVQSTIS